MRRPVIASLFRAAAVVAALAAPAVAEAGTLNSPRGITLDTAGNLYVANAGANNVTVYNAKNQLIRTISSHMSMPTSVAYIAGGFFEGIYVSNYTSASITAYGVDGTFNNSLSIYDPALAYPRAVVADPMSNLWVLDQGGVLHSYDVGLPLSTYAPQGLPTTTAVTFAPGGVSLFGANSLLSVTTTRLLLGQEPIGNYLAATNAPLIEFATTDAQGNQYATDPINQVVLTVSAASAATGVPQVQPMIYTGFAAEGIAVNSATKRIYVSDPRNNLVHIYNMVYPYAPSGLIQ